MILLPHESFHTFFCGGCNDLFQYHQYCIWTWLIENIDTHPSPLHVPCQELEWCLLHRLHYTTVATCSNVEKVQLAHGSMVYGGLGRYCIFFLTRYAEMSLKSSFIYLSIVAHSCFCSKPSIYPTHTGMEDNRAKTKKERRQALKEQWLNYLLTVAEEKICVSCWATQLKEWLPESHVGCWQVFVSYQK